MAPEFDCPTCRVGSGRFAASLCGDCTLSLPSVAGVFCLCVGNSLSTIGIITRYMPSWWGRSRLGKLDFARHLAQVVWTSEVRGSGAILCRIKNDGQRLRIKTLLLGLRYIAVGVGDRLLHKPRFPSLFSAVSWPTFITNALTATSRRERSVCILSAIGSPKNGISFQKSEPSAFKIPSSRMTVDSFSNDLGVEHNIRYGNVYHVADAVGARFDYALITRSVRLCADQSVDYTASCRVGKITKLRCSAEHGADEGYFLAGDLHDGAGIGCNFRSYHRPTIDLLGCNLKNLCIEDARRAYSFAP